MPISLDAPEWSELTTAYGTSCNQVIRWLRTAYLSGMTSDLLGDIVNEIQHQGDTSPAMYAVAPHLVALASNGENPMSRDLIVQAGLIHASAQTPAAESCPPELLEQFQLSAVAGRQSALRLLSELQDFDNFKYLVAALSGFMGHGRFGLILEKFELFEGQFHHVSLDDPIPE